MKYAIYIDIKIRFKLPKVLSGRNQIYCPIALKSNFQVGKVKGEKSRK